MFANGLSYLAIPGPSVMPDRVLRAMHRAAPNIYTGELHDVTRSLIPDLRSVAQTDHSVAIYIANGHGVWEAALSNVVAEGDTVLVLATGRFCIGWGEMAEGLGAHVETIDFGNSDAIDLAQVEAALRADTGGRIKAVLTCLVDTSTGVLNDIKGVRAAMDAAGHAALLMCDCIASLGCDEYRMDDWGVDVTVAASQKGLMTPPGIGFVWFNDRADAVREAMPRVSRYWDWRPRVEADEYWKYFDGTAPTHHIYGLREALDMIAQEGLEAVWARHAGLAEAIWAAIDVWSSAGPMQINVADKDARSRAVTSLKLDEGQGDALRAWCEDKMGVTLGIGLGRTPASAYFRLGHMGHVNGQMVLGFLGTIDAGLKALGIPHGAGAIEAAARKLADLAVADAGRTQADQAVDQCCG
ncbi:pyridoxal-phosphate-dependent aminotransferase family protein [Pseudooctadecabacter jejudonensis]|uniref:Soluble hydrogenase 42 kDa subunit n=1 Tax=Pseudooctadecabacter jejudonensis TaxID=1391910 RepID=A0A1Y5RRI0_9RHOB|nr:aminotransferase class V-fold PLP-dependent enzyme [Pseudooctadecabacter jejudonensis]SLN23737.1 Soluble hydrogenase 42 kDa subunit [Pseudooctadecabacter jejudonensis]